MNHRFKCSVCLQIILNCKFLHSKIEFLFCLVCTILWLLVVFFRNILMTLKQTGLAVKVGWMRSTWFCVLSAFNSFIYVLLEIKIRRIIVFAYRISFEKYLIRSEINKVCINNITITYKPCWHSSFVAFI